MSNALATGFPGGCHIFSGCGFPAPSIEDFYFKPFVTIGSFGFTKPILLMLIAAAAVLIFFGVAFSRPKLVPRGVQNLGELAILFVRDQILRPLMGKKGDRFLPFLVALFFFIWIMNLFEIIPAVMFPATSRYAFPFGLTLIVWFGYIGLGIKHHGLGYFKNMAAPQGAPAWILPLLAPIELFSNILVRPFTLSVRLFANMLAGHVLLLVFGAGAWYLFSLSIGLLFSAVSVTAYILITLLEVLVTLLQAFIFTILAAYYFSDSLESAH
ncbi:MAG: F0F1 ATP synthase subunit A [Actinobacteria bacterium]|nr:F0F1 ATP synthase subunit A [Actinomycetota bacterium]